MTAMAPHAPRRLLHLLISDDSAQALPIVQEQQRSGLGRIVLVFGPGVADLKAPEGVETMRLGRQFDERTLLMLIYESDSICVW